LHNFPVQAGSIATLFKDEATVALAWVHLLMLDLLQARYVLLDALRNHVPYKHSIVLCFMFGPTGLLSHLITRSLSRRLSGRRDVRETE